MSSASAVPRPRRQALETFRRKLEEEWKETAYCGRTYYRTDEIVKWMSQQANENISNVANLLREVHKESITRPKSDTISGCLIVFAILLDIGYGHLIEKFRQQDIRDNTLDQPLKPRAESIESNLARENVLDAKRALALFEEKRWCYNPCRILGTKYMFDDYRWVVPFCRKRPVNLKGGTAQVSEVTVPVRVMHHLEFMDHLSKESREAINRSRYEDNEFGDCYIFALKTFDAFTFFRFEKEAHHALRGKSGMIQYLGWYELDERLENDEVVRTYNILLEYGEEDLDEFFASPRNSPPILNAETVKFWEELAKVAKALEQLHNLDIELEGGEHSHYHGWHADLKPDNILRVHGEFKLADFGFAKFKRKALDQVPEEFMTGGTETYGAPECDRMRRSRGTKTSVTQTIDTWSFGCVLSVSATWVILGYQGVLTYAIVRQNAISKLKGEQAKREDVTAPTAADAFHNGRHVLQEVTQWHDYLRGVARKSDTITSGILELVEHQMLVEHDQRLQSNQLCNELSKILTRARHKYKGLIEGGYEKPVSAAIEEALLNVEAVSSMSSDTLSNAATAAAVLPQGGREGSHLLTTPHTRSHMKSSRINKAEKMRKAVQGSIAHRRDALEKSHEEEGTTSEASLYGGQPPMPSTPGHKSPRVSIQDLHESPIEYDIDSQSPPESGPYQQLLMPQTSPDSRPDFQFGRTGLIPRMPNEASPAWSAQVRRAGDPRAHIGSLPDTVGELPADMTPHNSSASRRTQLIPVLDQSRYGQLTKHSEYPTETAYTENHDYTRAQWPIYKEYQQKVGQNSLESFSAAFLKRRRPDEHLKLFLVNRDIKFLIDNDDTMLQYWDDMLVAFETLVRKVDGLDRDGLDLEFTMGETYSAKDAKAKQLLANFRKAKQEAISRNTHQHMVYQTDMEESLRNIFDRYLGNPKRKMTLIVFTDGLWHGTVDSKGMLDLKKVEIAITEFLKKSLFQDKLEKRWFTIQFVSFGNAGLGILKRLDDDIAKEYGIPDVIDTESISGDVDKMILGSFVPRYDAAPPTPTTPATPISPSSGQVSSPPSASPESPRRHNTSISEKRRSLNPFARQSK
ncbi:hypothetical protein F5Y15DRAFT_222823 [Xylariaceae sp. FL0016]|nr:hypothetical protein F5Y15DRAFT_222823 [Xylariaceae sp. FL0016]